MQLHRSPGLEGDGRIGYFLATGALVLVLTWFGILAVFLNLAPVLAIAPILLYIGMLIGNIPPAEAEENFYAQRGVLDMVA
jgi:hypothetical protein